MRSLTAIAALAVFLIVAEAPLREFLRAGRYRALRANLKPRAPPLNLSRVLEVAGAERCVGDGRCAGCELHDFAAAKGRMARVQAALNSKPAAKDSQKYMSSENEVELAVPADATNRPSLPKTTPEAAAAALPQKALGAVCDCLVRPDDRMYRGPDGGALRTAPEKLAHPRYRHIFQQQLDETFGPNTTAAPAHTEAATRAAARQVQEAWRATVGKAAAAGVLGNRSLHDALINAMESSMRLYLYEQPGFSTHPRRLPLLLGLVVGQRGGARGA